MRNQKHELFLDRSLDEKLKIALGLARVILEVLKIIALIVFLIG